MKKMSIILMAVLIQACSNPDQGSKDQQQKKDVPQRYQESYLSADQMPNEKTQYLKIQTQDMPDNQQLIEELDRNLQASNFILESEDDIHTWTLNDCDRNRIIQVEGEGMRRYTVTRTVALPDHPSKYPEFMLLVFEFSNEQDAKNNYKTLNDALLSGGNACNGKSPNMAVVNGNEIYYFTTPKPDYTVFIQQYSDLVENYNTNTGAKPKSN